MMHRNGICYSKKGGCAVREGCGAVAPGAARWRCGFRWAGAGKDHAWHLGTFAHAGAGRRKSSVCAAQKKMNEENNEARAKLPPASSDEEAVLLWVTVATLCERLRPSNVMRGISLRRKRRTKSCN